MNKSCAFGLFALLASLGLSPTAQAGSITVPNSFFETSSGSGSQPIADWTFVMPHAGSAYGTQGFGVGSEFPTVTGEGTAWAFMNNDVTGVAETLTTSSSVATIAADTTYTLTVAVGNQDASPDSANYASPGDVTLSLLADGTSFADRVVSDGTVANGEFEDFSFSFTTPDTGSVDGENLTIQLESNPLTSAPWVQAAFANVRLDATAVPEPTTWMLMGLGSLPLLWWVLRVKRA